MITFIAPYTTNLLKLYRFKKNDRPLVFVLRWTQCSPLGKEIKTHFPVTDTLLSDALPSQASGRKCVFLPLTKQKTAF